MSYAGRYGALEARIQERERVALEEYREAREHYISWPHRTDGDARIALLWAYTTRSRWTTLHELLPPAVDFDSVRGDAPLEGHL